jgi:aminoglycoside phosphotransferase (APT) family kinase protein
MHNQHCLRISDFVRQRTENAPDMEIRATPLLGGLENCGVFKVELGWTASHGNVCSDRFVVKRLVGNSTRELAVWRALAGTPAAHAMPAMYGAEWHGEDEAYLYQEFVEPHSGWPWADITTSVAVLKALAHVHGATAVDGDSLENWDYESDLIESAQATVALFASAVYGKAALGDRPMLRTLERILQALPAMRAALRSSGPTTLLHGDVHAGNAVVRNKSGAHSVVLLDWGRARLGSPLEDVSSWLQSVSFWEPEVKRRHDTLLRSYLRARRLPDSIGSELRELYWIATACNAMAGALRYHLAVTLDSGRPEEERYSAFHALLDWLRIIRRADLCWRN